VIAFVFVCALAVALWWDGGSSERYRNRAGSSSSPPWLPRDRTRPTPSRPAPIK
jgi:hypothetical protein